MENTSLSRYTVSFGLSLALCSVANAVLVVVKEKSPAVMAFLQKILGHHWASQSVLIIALFLLLGWGLARLNSRHGPQLAAGKTLSLATAGVVLGGIIIMGFYLLVG